MRDSRAAPRRIRLAVFDCDGTLVDSAHNIVEAMAEAFEANGLPRPAAEAVRRVVGLSLSVLMARLLPGQPPAVCGRVVESYRMAFLAQRQRPDHDEPLYAGALQAIDALEAAGFLLGIATGKSRRGLAAVLERHDLMRRFVTLQTADVAASKPDPEMLHRAMAEAGAATADTVMIGDTSFDMLMAGKAGVRAVGVAWGYHPPSELTAAGAQAIAADYPALPPLVCGLVP